MSDDDDLDVRRRTRDGSRLVAPEAEPDDAGASRGRCARARLDAFIGQQRVKDQLGLVLEAATGTRPRGRPRAARRPARARQDHAVDDHRGRAGDAAAGHQRSGAAARGRPRRGAVEPRARRGALPRRDPPDVARRRGDALPRDGGLPRRHHRGQGPGRHRDPARAPAVHAGRAPPPGPACCPGRCATGSASPRTWTSTTPPTSGRSSRAAPTLLEVSLDAGRRGRDRRPQPRDAPRGEPAAAPGARLRAGARRRARRPRAWPAPRSRSTRSTRSGSTGSTAPCSTPCCAASAGGPVGLSTLAVAVGEESETVETVCEPFLVRAGLLARTPRGPRRDARRPGRTSGCAPRPGRWRRAAALRRGRRADGGRASGEAPSLAQHVTGSHRSRPEGPRRGTARRAAAHRCCSRRRSTCSSSARRAPARSGPARRCSQLAPGERVMTTAGLFGTVTRSRATRWSSRSPPASASVT